MAKRRPSGDGMVRKRLDGRWEGRIVVGHKEDGTPIFRYVYGKTQRELLNKLHDLIDRYKDVELNEDSQLTLAQWLAKWLDEYKPGTIRDNTMRGYRMYTDSYICPILGDKKISAITPLDIQQMYAKLKKEGRIHSHPERGHQLSDAMLRRIHSMLHLALETAKQEHLIAANPTEGAVLPKENHPSKKILTDDELEIFMKAIAEDPVWHDFFYTELTTGLRRGELCALKWEDFNDRDGTLSVRRSVQTRKNGKLVIGETKTEQGTRKIILPPSTAQLLRKRKMSALTEWIFPNPLKPEEPTNPSAAYHHLKILLKHAGLPDLRFHDLRHTFSTHALTSGVDAKTLAGILGHTNASFTLDTYTHVTGDMQRKAADVVDDFLTDIFGEVL